eukprot:4809133-Ditylum_brightwellii.AAC.1
MFSKEKAASPTVSSEVVLLTSVIEANKRRDVAMTDIPATYLNADMDNEVIMVMEGWLTELM